MPAQDRRVVITGAGGRLGSALVKAFGQAGWSVTGWTRSEFDLDEPSVLPDLQAIRPSLVVHAAAWTDVDGCAREPDLAMQRNGHATRSLAHACAAADVALALISTNEVFDGARTDGQGYSVTDPTKPSNPYGASKLAGERWAAEVLDAGAFGIVRTAWLFGPGKPDFPAKIASAARSAMAEGRRLRVVADEIGTPTHVWDLAGGVARLAETSSAGVHHVVNRGRTSRAGWARAVLAGLDLDVEIEEITLAEFPRVSTPPRWGVLAPTALPGGPLRGWEEAMVERLSQLRESAA